MRAKRPDKRTRQAMRQASRFARKARIEREEALASGHCRSVWDNMGVRGKATVQWGNGDNRKASDVSLYR